MQDQTPVTPPPLWLSILRIVLRLVIVGLSVMAIHMLVGWVMAQADAPVGLMGASLLLVLIAYAVLIAIPFVPGIEIGVGLLVLSGAQMAPFVYLATVLGLLTAFGAGYLLPYKTLHRLFADLRFRAACRMLETVEDLSPDRRLILLRDKLPNWLGPFATKYRYLTLAILINIPGNALIGGGGGIALLAGISRVYGLRATALTVALAVAPIPIIIWTTGAPGLWLAG